MHIVVLGAGIVGVTTAYELSKDGHQVTVVDRQPLAANETSYGNAGMIAPGHALTWASPKAPMILLRSIVQSDQALRLKLSADPRMWAWCLRFLAQCTAPKSRANTLRKLALCQYSQECLGETVAATGVSYDRRTDGILYLFRDAQSFDKGAERAKILEEGGQTLERLDFDGVVGVDAALAGARDTIHGGLYCPTDETGDCHAFTNGLVEVCRERGVDFRFDTTITKVVTDGEQVVAVETDGEPVHGDGFVLSLGSQSPAVGRRIGVRLPIYPVKGYAVTLPVKNNNVAPKVAAVDENVLVAYTPMGERVRMTATAELSGYGTAHKPADFTTALGVARALFPDACDFDRASYWSGLRPMTPEGTPVLGRARYRNLYVNTGQGHMGWTMSHGSARVTADLIAGRTPAIDVSGMAYAA
ncbi:D-amino acid dehydrogenase [Acuticoccus sp.]|uniref:D-amino acid dehydrogenase n=1 Tax=Acuticoccus sp. TaxID=1904378 RepID=UPI003B51A862